jgi:hypothetical protein
MQMYFSKWGNEGIVDFRDEFSKLVTLTAARTLLGACSHERTACSWLRRP